MANPVYLINGKYVLRIEEHRFEHNPGKLKRESILLEILPKFNIPSPKLIGYDDSLEILDSPYILLKFIPGRDLLHSFKDLNPQQKKEISYQIGELATNFHQITPEKVGHEDLFGDIKLWEERYSRDFATYWEVISRSDFLPLEIKQEIEATFNKFKQVGWHGIGRLTHVDFTGSNIQLNNGKIVGIFDFEYTCIADPLLDLQKLPISFKLGDSFDQREFWKGYGVSQLGEEEKIRLKMHCFHQGIWEIWATVTKFMPFGEKELEEGKTLVKNTIEYDLLH